MMKMTLRERRKTERALQPRISVRTPGRTMTKTQKTMQTSTFFKKLKILKARAVLPVDKARANKEAREASSLHMSWARLELQHAGAVTTRRMTTVETAADVS